MAAQSGKLHFDVERRLADLLNRVVPAAVAATPVWRGRTLAGIRIEPFNPFRP